MSKYYFAIDIGGTEIKGGVINKDFEILYQDKISTREFAKTNSLSQTVVSFIEKLENGSGLKANKSDGIGIGVPGLVDNQSGIVEYVGCLKLKKVPLVEELKKHFKVPVKIANDAELATLAEQFVGNGIGYKSFVMLTIGTGIGCGIILNGVSLRQYFPFACEFGHTKITLSDKEDYESLSSTKALIHQTKLAMQENPNSKMWQTYSPETVNGKTVFEYKDTDKTAKTVFENYIKNLGTGIVNLCNTFAPEIVILGGGISAQCENLTKPLEDYVNKNIFINNINKQIKIIPAKLKNDAGILGAVCLFK